MTCGSFWMVIGRSGLLFLLLLAGCGGGDQTERSATPATTGAAVAPRPIVVDTDVDSSDVLALAMLLRDPTVDVRAVTVVGTGLVHCEPGVRNVRSLLGAFGLERPVACGLDEAGSDGLEFPEPWRAAADAFYGLELEPAAGAGAKGDAVSVLDEVLSAGPTEPTVVALGPWTNLEELLDRHPDAAGRIAGIHAMAGAVDVAGNVEPGGGSVAEWNVRADPSAFAAGLRAEIPISLVPLDATNRLPLTSSFLDELAEDRSATGAGIAWELLSSNPFLLSGSQFLWDELAAIAFVDSTLVEWEELRLGVETAGAEAGRLVRDESGPSVRVALGADRERAVASMLEALRRGGPAKSPAAVPEQLVYRWDGSSCRLVRGAPALAKSYLVTFEDRSSGTAVLYLASIQAPRTWKELEAFWRKTTTPNVPDWITPLADVLPNADGEPALVDFPAGTSGPICAEGSEYAVGEPSTIRAGP